MPPTHHPSPDPTFRPELMLEAFLRNGVDFLVVGGYSAMIRGVGVVTRDVDCMPATDRENLQRLAAAMNELGARFRVHGLSDEEAKALTPAVTWRNFTISGTGMTFRTDAGDLDILVQMVDGDGQLHGFDHYRPRATRLAVGSVTVLVASLDDVIASKEHADREKDRAVLPLLRAARDAEPT